MKILITGLSGSGKTMLAEALKKLLPNVFILNGDFVRRTYDDWDFSLQSRIRQAKRMLKLVKMYSNFEIIIMDFICPTEETREIVLADYVIFMNTIDSSPYADTDAMYEKPFKVDMEVTTKAACFWVSYIKKDLRLKFPQLFDIPPKT